MLTAGSQIPSTRKLATLLRLSRNTVTAAYRQLLSEGFLESIVGSGTRVSNKLPESNPFQPATNSAAIQSSINTGCLSTTGKMLQQFSQWPTTITMSLNRRMQLLAESHRRNSWILDDDYNGEYHSSGRPHPALCSLDQFGRTIYMGTFSKYLFPAIRLGFLIVPTSLRASFTQARWLLDRYSPTLSQQVLHRFIESGEFLKHLRKMRVLY